VALARAGPPAVSAAVVASDAAASARAAGFVASTLRMPVFTTDIYIGRVDSAQALNARYLVNSCALPGISWSTAGAVVGVAAVAAVVSQEHSTRRGGRPGSPLARWLLGLDITATLAANVAHGLRRP
jgi:hypothetical protein